MSNDFFGGHGSVERTAKRGFIAIAGLWVVSALFSIALLVGVIVVAWHFLAKVW